VTAIASRRAGPAAESIVRCVLFWLEAFYVLACIFLAGFFEVDVVNVCEGAEPCEDVGEFLLGVLVVFRDQGCGKLPDLLDEPHEGFWGASLAVAFFVFRGDQFLEFANVHLLGADMPGAEADD